MREETENDELRGVINDLTVENKKLKNAIRSRHIRSNVAINIPDRIFEVKMHGLPVAKKRELEEILRSFATGLGGSSSQLSSPGPRAKAASSVGYLSKIPQKRQPYPAPADSGYASLSNSGIRSTSQGASGSGTRERVPMSKDKKDTDIKKFLHDIPDSLHPTQIVSTSDSAKMQLIVQKLEDLFTGKRAAPGDHNLPRQQQQISRSAAKADRREDRRLNRTSRTEGTREAYILSSDSNVYPEVLEVRQAVNQSASDLLLPELAALPNIEQPACPDQRPTRPIDLDIHRAQVASDNIEYIRHLGPASPHFEDAVHSKGQPWMYLNLVVSMAQLHTLNVTPAFVREAVRQLSTQFALSKDGQKIRWIGDDDVAHLKSTHQVNPESALQCDSEDTGDAGGPRSGRSTACTLKHLSSSISDARHFGASSSNNPGLMNFTTASSYPANAQTSGTQSKATSTFDYKPVVFKGKGTLLETQESYLDSSSSYEGLSPESGGSVRFLSQSSRKSQEDFYDGCVTFFNNSPFFTDLSGDKAPTAAAPHSHQSVRVALGSVEEERPPVDDTLRDVAACYFLTPRPTERTSWLRDVSQIDMSLSPVRSSGEDETLPMELDASGIGGVRPEDNFALDVQIARKQQGIDGGKVKRRTDEKVRLRYSYQVAGCTRLDLQPSRLPPPSYVFFAASPSSETEKDYQYDDDDSEGSSEAESSSARAGFLWQWSTSDDNDDDVSKAGSVLGVSEPARVRLPQHGVINKTIRPISGGLVATVRAS